MRVTNGHQRVILAGACKQCRSSFVSIRLQRGLIVGFRRSPDRIAAARNWQRFVENNAHVISAAAVPPAATACIENWNDFLTHGYLAGDPGQFTVDQLAPLGYQSLVELVSNYFNAGYEFYAPMALSAEDRAALSARFASG